jgi:DnaJ domain
MRYLLVAAGALLVLGVLLRVFVTTPPENLARRLRMMAGIALVVVGGGLLFVRQFALGVTLGMAGLMLIRREAALRRAAGSGPSSTVRAAGIEMTLDHDTGEMDGRILAGRHEGQRLSGLGLAELLQVAGDFSGDTESLRLLETYLDRAHPGWRDNVEADKADRQGAPPRASGMDTKEAYQILGLQPGASEAEVRDAHRRLMKQVHPDHGGSAALAAKINEAKDRILGKHR